MKTWKRALALVLALVMALSLVALPSFAAGEEDLADARHQARPAMSRPACCAAAEVACSVRWV